MLPDIIIAAGQAYGSGAHPSTALCLQALQGVAQARPQMQRVLDVGCGSGVLAIAAAQMLPHAQVIASDTNPQAPEFTMHNAELNGVSAQITVLRAEGLRHEVITKNGPYELIFCNILAEVNIPLLPDIAKHLDAEGIAILSGIRKQYMQAMHDALQPTQLFCITTIEQKEWCAMIVRHET
jgi:ribosomal protein L11 methyltransferase